MDLKMDGDPWDLSTYHEDIQRAYNQLRSALPFLPTFQRPTEDSSISDTARTVLHNLQWYMSLYPIFFLDFVDEELELALFDGEGTISNRTGTGGQLKLKRMVQPLFSFSFRLNKAREKASRQLQEEVVDADYEELEASLEGVTVRTPQKRPVTPPSFRPPTSRSSPSKRASPSADRSDLYKRFKEVVEDENQRRPPGSAPGRSSKSAPARLATSIDGSMRHGPLDRTSSTESETSATSVISSATTSVIAPPTPTDRLARTFSMGNSAVASAGDTEVLKNNGYPVLLPPDASEQLIHVTPRTKYQILLDNQITPFHVQWELERLIYQNNMTWEDFEMRDFKHFYLGGTALEASKGVAGLLARVAERKFGKEYTGPLSRAPPKSDKRERLLRQVDEEEKNIMAGTMAGGNIVYRVIVKPLKDGLPIQVSSTGSKLDCDADSRQSSAARAGTPANHVRTREPTDSGPKNPFRTPLTTRPHEPLTLPFEMHLVPPEMPGKSFRLARRYGSRRVLTFKLKGFRSKGRNDVNHRDNMRNLFQGRIFVLFGRTFRAIDADDDTVQALEMDDFRRIYSAPKRLLAETAQVPSFKEFIQMYNDLEQKPNQAMAKWAARLGMLFSDSVPAAQVEPSAILEERDIVYKDATPNNATTEQTLTDGCGLMSESLARRIYTHPGLRLTNGRPSVVQMRLGGSKGLLALMSPAQHQTYAGKEVVLRDSMIKARPADGFMDEPSLLTIDVLGCDALRIGTSIPSEAIIAMCHGGVPSAVFEKMVEDGLEELRNDLLPHPLEGESPEKAMLRLVSGIYRRGGIGIDREKRKAQTENRSAQVAGLEPKFRKGKRGAADTMEAMEDECYGAIDPSERFDVDPISGLPGSISESLYEAVSNGFHPATSCFTAFKLHHLFKSCSSSMIRDFRIPVEESVSGYIVPDTLGILAPDEIFVAFSAQGPVDPDTGRTMPYLEGDCLAFRSPCKLPTDVRKFKAVWKHELAHLTDCIVMSANAELCKRSPASYLGGGDYDGDTAQICWGKELVDPFRNADDSFAEVPDDFIETNFDKGVVKVREFTEAMKAAGADEETRIWNMQSWLLGGICNVDATSDDSNFHGNAVYTLGFDHPETIRLARMFCHVLDARKSGLKVKSRVQSCDADKYGGDIRWRSWKKKKEAGENGGRVWRRGKQLGDFVMDVLMDKGKQKQTQLMVHFPSRLDPPGREDHEHLSDLWRREIELVRLYPAGLQAEFDLLKKHIEVCYHLWEKVNSGHLDAKQPVEEWYVFRLGGEEVPTSPRKGRTPFATGQQKAEEDAAAVRDQLVRLGQIRQLATIWRDKPDRKNIPLLMGRGYRWLREIKVSCGAEMPKYKSNQKFTFEMDFTTTCSLKADHSGHRTASSLRIIQDIMKPVYKKPQA